MQAESVLFTTIIYQGTLQRDNFLHMGTLSWVQRKCIWEAFSRPMGLSRSLTEPGAKALHPRQPQGDRCSSCDADRQPCTCPFYSRRLLNEVERPFLLSFSSKADLYIDFSPRPPATSQPAWRETERVGFVQEPQSQMHDTTTTCHIGLQGLAPGTGSRGVLQRMCQPSSFPSTHSAGGWLSLSRPWCWVPAWRTQL